MAPTTHQIDPGRFVILQGQPSSSFYILKSGKLEIFVNPDEPCPTESEVLRNGRRIAVIEEPNIPIGEIGVLENRPRSASVRAVEKSTLIEVEGDRTKMVSWMAANHQAGLLITRTMVNRIVRSHERWHGIRLLASKARACVGNLSALYSILSKSRPAPGSSEEKFYKKGREIISVSDRAGESKVVDLEKNIPDGSIPAPVHLPFPEIENIYFYHALLSQDDSSLGWLARQYRIHPLGFLSSSTAQVLPKMSRALYAEMTKGEEDLSDLFGASGIIECFLGLFASLGIEERESALPYYRKMLQLANAVFEEVVRLWGPTYPRPDVAQDNLKRIEDVLLGRVPLPEITESSVNDLRSEATAHPAVPATANARGYDLTRALESLSLTADEQSYFRICLGRCEAQPKEIYDAFWKLYPRVWLENRERHVPELTAFLRYGICPPQPFDIPAGLSLQDSQGPVMYADEWLRRVHGELSSPSRTDLGLTYEDFLKEEKRDRYREGEEFANVDKVLFEVEQTMAKAARAFSGGRGAPATVVRTQSDIDELSSRSLTPARIAEAIVRILQTDFSAFYRDVKVQLEARSEYLLKEIIPFAVIFPSEGIRALCWQEIEGRSKETPARLYFPHFLDADVFDAIISVVARFRWALSRTQAGADWMNPAAGYLTGAYFDYSAYYKKNRELTDDQKKKLADIYAGATMDEDRFAIEYAIWIKFESQGVQKLNKIARKIFAQFCPFSLETRRKLIQQPAFGDILRTDSNKRLKRREELERRIFKLERNGIVPGDHFLASLRFNEPIPDDQ